MKSRNYLLILLSLTLTGMPALAVDYVACREMLRTRNEFVMLVNKEDKEIEILLCNTQDSLCMALKSFGEPITDIRKRRERYYKKVLKVEADMKRANCPY